MLLSCHTQYVTKFGKLHNGQRTENVQFSIQFQRKATPKNVQTTIQLGSFQTLASLCSKSFKLDFSSIWTENFNMYNLYLEKAEEPEIKLPTSAGSQETQGNSRKTSTSASLIMLKALCGSQQTVENYSRDGNTRPPYLSSEKPVCRTRSNILYQTWSNGLVQKALHCHPAYAEYIMRNAGLEEAQAGIKIARRNITNLRYADDTTLWQKVKRN